MELDSLLTAISCTFQRAKDVTVARRGVVDEPECGSL